MKGLAVAAPMNTARVTSAPGDPWEVFGTFTSQPPAPPLPGRPMLVEVTAFYDVDAPEEEVALGLRRREDIIALEVALAAFRWDGPAGFHASQVFALEVWTPLEPGPAAEAPAEWLVLWVPAVQILMPSVIHSGPSEIAFTTEVSTLSSIRGQLAPASPAVPDEHRGRPVQYLYTKHRTTEGPPAVGS